MISVIRVSLLAALIVPTSAVAQGIPASAWPAQCQFEADKAVSSRGTRWQTIYRSCMAAREAEGAARYEAMTRAANNRADYYERRIRH